MGDRRDAVARLHRGGRRRTSWARPTLMRTSPETATAPTPRGATAGGAGPPRPGGAGWGDRRAAAPRLHRGGRRRTSWARPTLMRTPPETATASTRRLLRAALVLGIGLGGFFDGIAFHQLLQWHHMLSSRVPPDTVPNLELNTLLDGAFHASTWVITVVGVWLLLRANGAQHVENAGRVLIGGIVAGWGAFNVVEGLIDHYLLGLHHVRSGPDEALYDAAFLIWGAIFVAVGWWLVRAGRRESEG